jgi:hypothetical protein
VSALPGRRCHVATQERRSGDRIIREQRERTDHFRAADATGFETAIAHPRRNVSAGVMLRVERQERLEE